MILLPSEVIIEIIKRASDFTADDYHTLVSLYQTCRHIRELMTARRDIIEEAYMYYLQSWSSTTYYLYGRRHRRDGPAEIESGTQYWAQYGSWHRDGDLPAVLSADGFRKTWYRRGYIYRDNDLPADYYHARWYWIAGGYLHRAIGPATVAIRGDAEGVNGALIPWDGRSDVSSAIFDWGHVIAIEKVAMDRVLILFHWYTHGELIGSIQRRLVRTEAGAYVIDTPI